jgi:hypothetical protein
MNDETKRQIDLGCGCFLASVTGILILGLAGYFAFHMGWLGD